jgi:hypothetical protein
MPPPSPADACVSALVATALLALALTACSQERTGPSTTDATSQAQDLQSQDAAAGVGPGVTVVETNPPAGQGQNSLLASPDPPLIPAIPSENDDDRALSDSIRATLIADSGLSAAARSITVSTIDGLVTLRGQVGSEAELAIIVSKVESMAGVRQVENRITVGR